MSKIKAMRGFTTHHAVDMSMVFRFVDRQGKYVYEVHSYRSGKIMGVLRVDWDKGEVQSDLIPVDGTQNEAVEEPDQTDMQLEKPVHKNCTHSWQLISPGSGELVCQRCGATKLTDKRGALL